MEIRALHCSDLHLDTSFPHIRDMGNQKRLELKEAFSILIDRAAAEKVNLMLIAGDLFDHRRVSPATLELIKEGMKSLAPVPVFITPGNLDPWMPDSPYCYSKWPPNVHIFSSNRFKVFEIPEMKIYLYGAAQRSMHDTFPVLRGFTPKNKEGTHIVLFHGSYREHNPGGKEQCFPFDGCDLQKCRATYLALGHYHDAWEIPVRDNPLRAAYAGSPDYLDYESSGEKGAILVTIREKQVETSFIAVGKRKMHQETIHCSRDITSYMTEHGAEAAFTRLIVNGAAGKPLDCESLMNRLKDRFPGISIIDHTVLTPERFYPEHSNSILSHFGNFIFKEMADADSEKKMILAKALYEGLNAMRPRKAGQL